MRRIVIERLITIGAREHKEDSLRFQIQISRCETERCEIEKLDGSREFFWLMEEFGLTVILKLLQGLQRPIRFAHSVLMRVGTWIKSKGLLVLFGKTSDYNYALQRPTQEQFLEEVKQQNRLKLYISNIIYFSTVDSFKCLLIAAV